MPELIQTADDRTCNLRLLMNTDNVGGVWSFTQTLLAALESADVEVLLAINGAPLRPDQRQALARLPHVTAWHGGFALEWMADPWDSVRACGDWLEDLANHFEPDIVHLNDYSHAARDFAAPTVVVGHSDVYSWFAAVKLGEPDHADAAPYWRHVTAGLQGADAVTAPTESVLDSLNQHYGQFARRPAIANGLATSAGGPAQEMPLKIPTLILAAARLWDEAKNMRVLDLAREAGAPPICAAGSPHHPANGTLRFPHLELLGELAPEELALQRSTAAIHVAPSLYEPFGLSNLEAARQHCALVLGDIPTQREIWGDAAVFLDPRDPLAFREMLEHLVCYPGEREEMAERAFAHSLQYTAERQAAAYLELYQSLLHPEITGPAEITNPTSTAPALF